MRTNILDIASELLNRYTVRGFIVPANSGTTARAVMQHFGRGYQYFAVGNPTTSHEKGFVIHSGMSEATRYELEQLGYTVILQEVSTFQGPGTGALNNPGDASPVFLEHARGMQASYERATGTRRVRIDKTTLSWIVESTIRALFDEQVKTCVELALMAGESDKIEKAGRYVAFCTPSRWSNSRDCAVVLRPSTPGDFYQNPPRIYEVGYSDEPSGGP